MNDATEKTRLMLQFFTVTLYGEYIEVRVRGPPHEGQTKTIQRKYNQKKNGLTRIEKSSARTPSVQHSTERLQTLHSRV